MAQEELIEYIEHDGIVDSVDTAHNKVTVTVIDKDECGSCPAATLCRAGDGTHNQIEVITPHAASYKKGDEVTIRGSEQMHHKAVMYATVIPCIALVAVMVGVYLLTFNQLAAALSGLAATAVCFIALYACRNKIAHEFTFKIVSKKSPQS